MIKGITKNLFKKHLKDDQTKPSKQTFSQDDWLKYLSLIKKYRTNKS